MKNIPIDLKVATGYYSDTYFNRTKEILEKEKYHPKLRMQIFQRNDNACLCGIDESISILKVGMGKNFKKVKISALRDGDIVKAWETVMIIEGDYSLFAHLETVYLGALARGTKVATNVYNCVKAANGKPVLFFPARFDSYTVQSKDGYSYKVGSTAASGKISGGVSTDAQGEWLGIKGMGTVPHGLIAAYKGSTVAAALAFAETMDPEIKRVVLVDYENDCVKTTLEVADAMFMNYQKARDKRYKLFGVRLDTSGNMVDKSMLTQITGVNPQLVRNVKEALSERMRACGPRGKRFYSNIGIIVSGGFDVEKIKIFENLNLPVSAYGVGSSIFRSNFDFTADIVQRFEGGKWVRNAKEGRGYTENNRMRKV